MNYSNIQKKETLFTVSIDQTKNEILYKKTLRLLKILAIQNIITREEFYKIDNLNKITFEINI